MEQQKKKWIEVYSGLEVDVAMEYDHLAGSKHDKDGNYVNFDPRSQFANKKVFLLILLVCNGSENISCEMQNMNPVDNGSDMHVDDFDGEEDRDEDEDSDSEYLGLITETRRDNQPLHRLNLLIPVDQIDVSRVPQNLVPNDATKVTNSSQIDELKPKSNEIKKEKRHRKNRKGLKKHLNDDFERQSVCDCDKRGDRARVVYNREELEGLRWYVGMEQQKKKWIEVYSGLEVDVAMEYDHLAGSKHDKDGNYVNFDPRSQFANKKGVSADFIGNGSENISCEMQNMNPVDNGSDMHVDDFDGEEDCDEDEDSDSEYLGLITETRRDNQPLHRLNLLIPVDQIDVSRVPQNLVPNDATKVTNSSQIDELKPKGNEIKKEKRHRKNRKGLKKHLNDDFERQSVCDCDKRGDRA
ncbi:hypothetical protein QVD17_08858 [Tagetes erecta]|uniref:Uncharacterized protein n=1 Tax=Tagetes erecta TaxID=13708 RepID=A0AAD8P4Q6_TARER|nr:hypothetical protein QVD17_08858 [Tagetes erecta]